MTEQHADEVTARRAAELTGLNERTIRRWIASGKLPARKVAVNRYVIEPADLPPRRRNRLRDELDELRADLEALTRRVRALERARMLPARASGESDVSGGEDASSISLPPYRPPVGLLSAPFPSGTQGAVTGGLLRRESDCCRFLHRHGPALGTPKGWDWLKPGLPWTEHDLLQRTAQHIRDTGWRASGIVLHKCTQAACPCQDMSALSLSLPLD